MKSANSKQEIQLLQKAAHFTLKWPIIKELQTKILAAK